MNVLLRKNCARAREAQRETFFFCSRVPVLCGQFIALVVSSYKRDENKRTEAIGTRRYRRDARSFLLCTTHFPRVQRCACITSVHRAALARCVYNVHQYLWKCKISNIKKLYNAPWPWANHFSWSFQGTAENITFLSAKVEQYEIAVGRSNVEPFGFMTGVVIHMFTILAVNLLSIFDVQTLGGKVRHRSLTTLNQMRGYKGKQNFRKYFFFVSFFNEINRLFLLVSRREFANYYAFDSQMWIK